MKPTLTHRRTAFTLVELVLVICVLALLFSMFPVSFAHSKQKAQRIYCLNNVKEIGTAYRLWAGDNGELPPYLQSVAKGGWKELLTNGNQGGIGWTNYRIMQNELGQSPKIVVCPADDRRAANSFVTDFGNANDSYFIGVSEDSTNPDSIQGGDRNLGPANQTNLNYGFSPKDGKGNDVAVPITGLVSWSLKLHSDGNTAGAGNILMGDGSGQQVTSGSLNAVWLRNARPTTNWPAGHTPATPSIRLVFP
jgi:competence protein ComGC